MASFHLELGSSGARRRFRHHGIGIGQRYGPVRHQRDQHLLHRRRLHHALASLLLCFDYLLVAPHVQTIGGTQRIFNVLPRPPFNTYLMIIGYDYAIGGGEGAKSANSNQASRRDEIFYWF